MNQKNSSNKQNNSSNAGRPKCTNCTDFFICNPKIVRILFSSNCTDFYPGNTPFFLNFHSFQQVFHENFKNKSRQNEVS